MGKVRTLKTVSFTLAFALAIAACVFVLSSGQRTAAAGGLDRYDSEMQFPVDSNGEAQDAVYIDGFVVRQRTYSLDGNGIVVLEVENQTEVNCSVTILGNYLDGDGDVVRQETKTFEGFSAGWKNYFFFRADFPFADFTYLLQAEACDGESMASQVELSWKLSRGYAVAPEDEARLEQAETPADAGNTSAFRTVPAVFLDLLYTNRAEYDIEFAGEYLVIDSNGKAYTVNPFACEAKGQTEGGSKHSVIYYWASEDGGAFADYAGLGYPEELRGNVTVYVSLTAAAGGTPSGATGEEPFMTRNFAVQGWADSSFSASGRRYTDETGKNDVVVLDVKNHSGENLALTVRARYLSRFGTLLKEETKTFAGFANGWSNSFIFDPGIEFYEFTYTLESAPYAGTCSASQVTVATSLTDAIGYAPEAPEHLADYWASGVLPPQRSMVCLELNRKNGNALDVRLRGRLLVIGADGRLLCSEPERECLLPAGENVCTALTLCPFEPGGLLPEVLYGNRVRVIYAITGAEVILEPSEV